MAKHTLDLYMLYQEVVRRGGLVEVCEEINRWLFVFLDTHIVVDENLNSWWRCAIKGRWENLMKCSEVEDRKIIPFRLFAFCCVKNVKKALKNCISDCLNFQHCSWLHGRRPSQNTDIHLQSDRLAFLAVSSTGRPSHWSSRPVSTPFMLALMYEKGCFKINGACHD